MIKAEIKKCTHACLPGCFMLLTPLAAKIGRILVYYIIAEAKGICCLPAIKGFTVFRHETLYISHTKTPDA